MKHLICFFIILSWSLPIFAQGRFYDSQLTFSGTTFKPRDNDEILFSGLKFGYEKNTSTLASIGAFLEFKLANHEYGSGTPYVEKVEYSMFSLGGEYIFYLSPKRELFFGSEFLYCSLVSKLKSNGKIYSETTEGFGIVPKMGGGVYTSEKAYLFLCFKYHLITFDEEDDLRGLGVEAGFSYEL